MQTLQKEHMLNKGGSHDVDQQDIEHGLNTSVESEQVVRSDEVLAEEYTHICMPCPGIGIDEISTDDGARGVNSDHEKKREVPIFCAVCLTEYEISDRICWSNNKKCTHVFHEDCVTQWLVTLGRNKSSLRKYPRNLEEKKVLHYDLECPCCRQAFILKGFDKE